MYERHSLSEGAIGAKSSVVMKTAHLTVRDWL